MIRCLPPVIRLSDCDGRIAIKLADCSRCTADTVSLILSQDGCPEYETICEEVPCENRSFGCGCQPCGTTVVQRVVEIPKASVEYPLHEINCDGEAVFVLDNKLKQLGYGRYIATITQDKCPPLVFYVDYQCGSGVIQTISTNKSSPMGVRC